MAMRTPRMRPHSKSPLEYIKVLWWFVRPGDFLLLRRIREARRERAIIQSRLKRDWGTGKWTSPPHQFLPKPLLGGKGWQAYLPLPRPPVRAQGETPACWRGLPP